MQLLFYKPKTVAEEVSNILTSAIQHTKMDEIFKNNYIFFAFLRLDRVEPMWQYQVRELHELWPKLVDVIDRDDISTIFTMECQEVGLPVEEYDLDSAFLKAQNEWAQELMVATANCILRWNENKVITTPVACWHNGRIFVDIIVCDRYRGFFFW